MRLQPPRVIINLFVLPAECSSRDGSVLVEVDADRIAVHEQDYRRPVRLAEKGRFAEAKQVLERLIEANPTVSDFHRLYGQILSDEGRSEEALDSLVDAARWDPRNAAALTMIGNIYARDRQDIDTALRFYERAVELDPENHIALNNIGGTLIKAGREREGVEYLQRALALNQAYPNTHYGLGLVAAQHGRYQFTRTTCNRSSRERGMLPPL